MKQIFLAPSKYGADLVQEWLQEEGIESEVVYATDPTHDPERRTTGYYAIFCHDADHDAAVAVLDHLELWSPPIGVHERIALLPELDDEDLLNTFVEEFHRNPAVSIAAEMELERRGNKPSQSTVDRLFHTANEQQEWENTPIQESIRHYLSIVLIPFWGLILGTLLLVAPDHPEFSPKRWFKNANAHGGAVGTIFGGLIWLMLVFTFAVNIYWRIQRK
ncbi:MAG: hypothetical protein IPN95_02455 [Bacteroidetes bacterium]|nr:hypothetical protein [Bacteroidota bacterium]